MRTPTFFEYGNAVPITLIASAFIAFMAIIGSQFADELTAKATMSIVPSNTTLHRGDTFTVDITVDSRVPANVFAGELTFDNRILAVTAIQYNTSIADLWAERPWYENGAGTVNFGGGTTKSGGFTGSGTLMSITFNTIGEGSGIMALRDARILRHDGLGTDATLRENIDTIITVSGAAHLRLDDGTRTLPYTVTDEAPEPPHTTDLNGDGKQSLSDVSIFMRYLTQGDLRGDFDNDGKVGTKDLARILGSESP